MDAIVHDDAEHQMAVRLGASLEARRLGCPAIGTEHLLMATLGDPLVRWTLKGLGHDQREVQTLVDHVSRTRSAPDGAALGLTDPARGLIAKVWAEHAEFDPYGPIDPALYSQVLQSLLTVMLTHDTDCAARRVLDGLGVTKHARSVLAVIEENAGPSFLPRQ